MNLSISWRDCHECQTAGGELHHLLWTFFPWLWRCSTSRSSFVSCQALLVPSGTWRGVAPLCWRCTRRCSRLHSLVRQLSGCPSESDVCSLEFVHTGVQRVQILSLRSGFCGTWRAEEQDTCPIPLAGQSSPSLAQFSVPDSLSRPIRWFVDGTLTWLIGGFPWACKFHPSWLRWTDSSCRCVWRTEGQSMQTSPSVLRWLSQWWCFGGQRLQGIGSHRQPWRGCSASLRWFYWRVQWYRRLHAGMARRRLLLVQGERGRRVPEGWFSGNDDKIGRIPWRPPSCRSRKSEAWFCQESSWLHDDQPTDCREPVPSQHSETSVGRRFAGAYFLDPVLCASASHSGSKNLLISYELWEVGFVRTRRGANDHDLPSGIQWAHPSSPSRGGSLWCWGDEVAVLCLPELTSASSQRGANHSGILIAWQRESRIRLLRCHIEKISDTVSALCEIFTAVPLR